MGKILIEFDETSQMQRVRHSKGSGSLDAIFSVLATGLFGITLSEVEVFVNTVCVSVPTMSLV